MDSDASLLDAGHQPGLLALLSPAHLAQEVEVLRVQEVSPGHGICSLYSVLQSIHYYGHNAMQWSPHYGHL